jgi:hypothetical protein
MANDNKIKPAKKPVLDKKMQKLADALLNGVLYKNGALEGKRRVRSFKGALRVDCHDEHSMTLSMLLLFYTHRAAAD